MDWVKRLCKLAHLGEPAAEPTPVSGGLLHRMYALETISGKYAVKLLNPEIMTRPDAMGNYCLAEVLEAKLEAHDLPILAAMQVDGMKMLRFGDQYAYLFPWYDGRIIRGEAVTTRHAAAIGRTLAGVHAVERRACAALPDPLSIPWDALLPACPELLPYRDLLHALTDRSNEAQQRLPPVQTICHNDLDTKNVLWQGDEHRVIDLETLAFSNPYVELLETALYWSGIEEHRLDTARFEAFIAAYSAAGGELPQDWALLLDSDRGRLQWLAHVLHQRDAAQARETMERILCAQDIRLYLLHL